MQDTIYTSDYWSEGLSLLRALNDGYAVEDQVAEYLKDLPKLQKLYGPIGQYRLIDGRIFPSVPGRDPE